MSTISGQFQQDTGRGASDGSIADLQHSASSVQPLTSSILLSASDILDLLTTLVDKSLVQYRDAAGAGRYWLLETIRQYGHEKLLESEADAGQALRDRHLEYFAQLAESLLPILDAETTGDQVAILKRANLEIDNSRLAMEWAIETTRVELFWRLGHSVLVIWNSRSLLPEYMDRVNRFLRMPSLTADHPYRAHAYMALSFYYSQLGDWAAAHEYAEKALAIGLVIGNNDIQKRALAFLASTEIFKGDYVQARIYLTAQSALRHDLNYVYDGWDADRGFGLLALVEGDYTQAIEFLARSHGSFRAKGHRLMASLDGRILGYAQLYAGDIPAAIQSLRESLIDSSTLEDNKSVAACLAAFAALALAQGDPLRSAQLIGACDAVSDAIHTRINPEDRMQYDRNVAELRKRIDAATLEAAWAKGRAMTYDQAVEFALAESDPSRRGEPAVGRTT